MASHRNIQVAGSPSLSITDHQQRQEKEGFSHAQMHAGPFARTYIFPQQAIIIQLTSS